MKKNRKKHLRRLAARREERAAARDRAELDFLKNIPPEKILSGTIALTASGFGFVETEPRTPEEKSQNVFIPIPFLNGAMDGDKVKLILLKEKNGRQEDRGPAGRITEVVSRSRDTIVGELISGHMVRPMSSLIKKDIPVSGRLHGAGRGDWVRLKLIHDDTPGQQHLSGRIQKTIGRAGTVKTDLDAVCAEYELMPPYSPDEEAEAENITPREIPREDLRKLYTVTIDPADAKDFDDALSIAPGKTPGTLEIGVHISDAAAFIAPRSKWDKAAARRGFTAYLPGRTLPMLPKSLTRKISLHPGGDCPAHSVIFQIEKKSGKIIDYRRCHSLVSINRRLDYETVQEFLDCGTAPESWSAREQTRLKQLAALTHAMRKNRMKTDAFIDLDLPEIRVMCDENADKINGLARKIQREAEFMVEECMLAANSAVGLEMLTRRIAGIYRIHDEPAPEKLAEFAMTAAESFGINPGDLSDRRQCGRFIKELPDDPRRPVLLSLFLRALPRAGYQVKPSLHFGLGKDKYSHFTSPIRRYPDLLVHQQLWNYDRKQRLINAKSMEAAAAGCTAQEEKNDNACFAAGDRLKLRYLQEQLDAGRENFYEAVIAKVNANGLLADIPSLGIYGFVPRENLSGERFIRRRGRLSDDREERRYRCGDYIYLKLSHIDPVRGMAEFKTAGH